MFGRIRGDANVQLVLPHLPPITARVTSYSRPASDIERIFYSSLIHRLKARRVMLGLTMEELDHELGVSEGQVAKWESFVRLPGAFMFMCWSNRLGLIINVETGQIDQQREAA
jgi:hypothetical protein